MPNRKIMPKSKTKKYIHNLTHPLLSAMACLTNGYINNPLHKTCQQCPIGLSLHLGSSISLQFGNQPVKQFLISLISLKAVARGLYLKAIQVASNGCLARKNQTDCPPHLIDNKNKICCLERPILMPY